LVFVCLWRGRLRWIGFAPVVVALIQPWVTPVPDLLVDESAAVFAVSDASGELVIRPSRGGRFVREVMAERYDASAESWPRAGTANEALGLSCDASGCALHRNGQNAVLAFNAAAVAEECGRADLIVSAVAAYDFCRRGRIIDYVDLRRSGGHAIWLGSDSVRVRTAVGGIGHRVWTRGVPREVVAEYPEGSDAIQGD
jgi:competence protein ComEC